MTKFCRVAIATVLALVTFRPTGAQDFSQFDAGIPQQADEATQAVYASLSDIEGPAYTERQVAFESISDLEAPMASGAEAGSTLAAIGDSSVDDVLSNRHGLDVNDGGVGQASLLGPAWGVTGAACGLPNGAACGLPDVAASCGLPSGPTCGAPTGCTSCGGCSGIQCGSLCTRQCPTCCGVGTHYSHFYGELLYLRARNAEVAYAVPIDGGILAGQPSPIQVGNVGILDPDYELGFRAGVNIALDTVSSLDVRYTMFESLTEDETNAVAPFVLRSLVTHPASSTAAQDALSASASLEVDFDLIDVSYRHLLKCCDLYAVNYVLGGRYAKLEQQFDVNFVKNGLETVATDIDFDGAGMRLGLEGQRYSCRNQLHVYANGYASFLAGRFRASYFQGQAFDPTVVNAEWEAGRVVPILDVECGVGWTSQSGKLRLNAGYMVSAWFNSVTTQDYINAIQTNGYLGLSDTITFDGLQARFDYRF